MRKVEILEKIKNNNLPTHIAFILDGNGRWAKKRGLPRNFGHQKGANTLQEVARSCNRLHIKYMSAYVFSTENWSRPLEEVNYLMNTIKKLCLEYKKLIKENIKLQVIGSKNNLSTDVIEAIELATSMTSSCTGLVLILAINYGAKLEIVDTTKKIAQKVLKQEIKIDDINEELFNNNLYTKDIPPVDFLIRTSGEIRLSNFMLWQIAYAELYFTKIFWPDFHTKELYEAISDYQTRKRRYGGLEK